MNKVIVSGRLKFGGEAKTSKNGNKYFRDKIVVDRADGKTYDEIWFIAFGEEALLLAHAVQNSVIELTGEWRVNYDKQAKKEEHYLFVKEVQVNEVYEEAPMVEDDIPIDMPDDDLPF